MPLGPANSFRRPVDGSLPGVRNQSSARRGWSVIAGIFVMLMTSAGLGFYGMSVYLSTLTKTRGFSVSALSGATALFFITSGFAGVWIAKLLRTVDPRPIVIVGALIAGGALVMMGRVSELWQMFVVYACFGVGYSATALVVSTTLVARWFDRKRAMALSIASTGLSVGGIVLTPVARYWLSHETLTQATTRIGLLYVLVVIPLGVLLLRPFPAAYGLGPDGVALTQEEQSTGAATQKVGLRYEEAVASLAFRLLTLVFFLALGAQVGAIAQLVKLADERIANASTAGRVVSVLAACSVAGRLLGGAVLSRTGGRRFCIGVLSLQAISIGTLAFARGSFPVIAGAMGFGLAIGNVLLLHPLLLADEFGVADYPRIFGRSQFFTTFGVAFGPFLFGWLRDHAGGYQTSYLVGAALSVVGLVAYATFTRASITRPELA